MNKRRLLLSFLLVVVIPQFLFSLFLRDSPKKDPIKEEPIIHPEHSNFISVKDGESVIQMELDDYVAGVVLGEMPADFELEALKAQAVATRTYTLRRVLRSGKHSNAHVCTESACCQAFVPVSEYLGGDEKLEKVNHAVKETSGQVLTYDGKLIEATYFSTSGGRTEDAVAVWGANVPYLRSVDSPGEEISKHYETAVTISVGDFIKKLGLPADFQLSEDNIDVTYTNGGGVDTLTLDGKTFSGTQLRTLLDLSSTALTLDIAGDRVLITTKGNGHRVGMSQYGAEAMAVNGYSYDQILLHYYSGATLEEFTEEQINAIFDKAENL